MFGESGDFSALGSIFNLCMLRNITTNMLHCLLIIIHISIAFKFLLLSYTTYYYTIFRGYLGPKIDLEIISFCFRT